MFKAFDKIERSKKIIAEHIFSPDQHDQQELNWQLTPLKKKIFMYQMTTENMLRTHEEKKSNV